MRKEAKVHAWPLANRLLDRGVWLPDRGADLRSQAESQASFVQGLSDGYFGKDSPPTYSQAGSFYAPNSP